MINELLRLIWKFLSIKMHIGFLAAGLYVQLIWNTAISVSAHPSSTIKSFTSKDGLFRSATCFQGPSRPINISDCHEAWDQFSQAFRNLGTYESLYLWWSRYTSFHPGPDVLNVATPFRLKHGQIPLAAKALRVLIIDEMKERARLGYMSVSTLHKLHILVRWPQ